MKQILFPTAYSSQSKVAYRYAQKLASYFDAGITLVHIYKNPIATYAETDDLPEKYKSDQEAKQDAYWEDEMAKLKGFAAEMHTKQYADIPLDYIVTDGNVANELLQIQKNNDFDIVIMGMRRHSLKEKLFGTTAYTLINESDGHIMLIPPDAHFMGLDNIVYGTAFEFGDKNAIEYLLDWCQAFDATLHVLHVHDPEFRKIAADKMFKLGKNFEEEFNHRIVKFQLMEGKITDTVHQYLKQTKADLLSLHRRKKGLWQRIREGSLTKILAEEVKIPLLILKS